MAQTSGRGIGAGLDNLPAGASGRFSHMMLVTNGETENAATVVQKLIAHTKH